jgi:hypothetical protein
MRARPALRHPARREDKNDSIARPYPISESNCQELWIDPSASQQRSTTAQRYRHRPGCGPAAPRRPPRPHRRAPDTRASSRAVGYRWYERLSPEGSTETFLGGQRGLPVVDRVGGLPASTPRCRPISSWRPLLGPASRGRRLARAFRGWPAILCPILK